MLRANNTTSANAKIGEEGIKKVCFQPHPDPNLQGFYLQENLKFGKILKTTKNIILNTYGHTNLSQLLQATGTPISGNFTTIGCLNKTYRCDTIWVDVMTAPMTTNLPHPKLEKLPHFSRMVSQNPSELSMNTGCQPLNMCPRILAQTKPTQHPKQNDGSTTNLTQLL